MFAMQETKSENKGVGNRPRIKEANMRYFVKSHFQGWCEVDEERYNRFIDNILKNATGLKSEHKKDYIKQVTDTKGA